MCCKYWPIQKNEKNGTDILPDPWTNSLKLRNSDIWPNTNKCGTTTIYTTYYQLQKSSTNNTKKSQEIITLSWKLAFLKQLSASVVVAVPIVKGRIVTATSGTARIGTGSACGYYYDWYNNNNCSHHTEDYTTHCATNGNSRVGLGSFLVSIRSRYCSLKEKKEIAWTCY